MTVKMFVRSEAPARRRISTALAAALVAGLASAAGAQVTQVYTNMPNLPTPWDTDPNHSAVATGPGYGSSGSNNKFAVAFTPSQTCTFLAAQLVLDSFSSVGNTGIVSLLSDNAGLPGATLFSSVTQPANNSGGAYFPGEAATNGVFADPNVNPITLEAGTPYWISLSVTQLNTRLRWWATPSDTTSPLAFGNEPLYGPVWFLQTAQQGLERPAFSIVGIVPAPASAALLGVGCVVAARRRRGR
jgi:hypothetical protein